MRRLLSINKIAFLFLLEDFPIYLEIFPISKQITNFILSKVFYMPIANDNQKVQRVLEKYKKKYDNSIALFMSSKKGLDPQAAFDLIAITFLPGAVIEGILLVSLKTLTNYKQRKTHLNAAISEKVLSIFALYKKGISIFGSVDAFNKWMAAPAYGLGGEHPNELLDTITGINLINEELTRIEYGDVA